ncbi:MAG: nucleotidyl transferase AbiEii/AbiGii toxin family protein [Smithella sp.]|jgi:predicted nucleotidyltransferase component of viral defense system|nr:nucleotidyl transferase AbiEii/AbiGii toxin family protein [Syntrophaceae bacterium]MBP9531831.1 nucleotidyl transferase AbiEii/AbiGii toxin family protein [Syntrophaceae bacterium]NMC91753.1 nucleotidyl transferase AbiEii/AbiGii toxin family protein [Smithella sp.]
MISIRQIEQAYPERLRGFKRNILREYLQYKILEIIFNSGLAHRLSFLGGTALRIVHENNRFSEDLDFDNFKLSENDFMRLTKEIQNGLQKEGYDVEIRAVMKSAFRCYVKLPQVLFDNAMSNLKDEKILIQVDTEPHEYSYKPDKVFLNKFDIFTQIFVTPPDILLSQKICALLSRKRAKGRDFYDVIFLLQKTKPDYEYLKQKVGPADAGALKNKMLEYVKTLNLKDLAKDVEPFLFQPSDSKKIVLFSEYLQQVEL